MMALDDGAADGQSDPHAIAFRCVKSIKQLVDALAVEAHADIPYTHQHTVAVLPFGSDQQFPRGIV
jgi:hypothetical protein